MKKIILNFYECEHYEDLSNYAEDVKACGGVVDGHEVNHADETGTLECTVPLDFWPKFKTTNAYEFLEGI
jgi:hypothetical protein